MPTPPKEGRQGVIRLGWVSLLTDISSEMLYAINPLFLTQVLGANMRIIGLIEGIAEGTAAILKGLSGIYSDILKKRKVFITLGYSLSAISKPIIGLASAWTIVLGARFIDRVGKGIRTTARDALIADLTPPPQRGWAFGLHRTMDTMGAFAGVAISLLLLLWLTGRSEEERAFRTLYFLAFIPALIGVILTLQVKDVPADSQQNNYTSPHNTPFSKLPSPYYRFLALYSLFALANSSDAFLLMKAKQVGFSAHSVVFLYLIFNASYGLFSYPFGRLADRLPKTQILGAGFLLYGAVYLGFARFDSQWVIGGLFFLYGVYTAMTEGVSKALITLVSPPESRGKALGMFYTITGLLFLTASLLAGFLWDKISPQAPFYFGAFFSVVAGVGFFLFPVKPLGG